MLRFAIACTAMLGTLGAFAVPPQKVQPFEVIERAIDRNGAEQYLLRPLIGYERQNNALNRLSLLSEDQFDYPAPESGCGPTAMLNILVWYERFGLIEPYSREADIETYKRELFREIDRRITKMAGVPRTEESGTSNAHVALVMDAFVQEQSDGRLRIHTDYIESPLVLEDLLETMPNFRAGYLLVTPKDKESGELLNLHAVTLIRADRAGYLTLGTWGKKYVGLLKSRHGEQWFIPQDPAHLELRIEGLMRFIPFSPVAAAANPSPR